jgi:hypothetical protein
MKKKFFGVACILALSGVLTTGQIITNKRNALTNLENANIEALTGDYSLDVLQELMKRCKNPKYALNQKLDIVDYETGTFTCDIEGLLKSLGINIPGDVKVNLGFEYVYDILACKEAIGSCCDQNKVGSNYASIRFFKL